MSLRPAYRGFAFLAFCLCGSTARSQAPSELARQHLESGIQFYGQQRYRQALNDFQAIVTSMSSTEYADDALLHIGRYYLDVEEDFDKAKENFETILRAYPTSDAAPGAYYFLGELLFRSDRAGRSIDDAVANYQRVFLYPGNPWIPAALFSTGRSLEHQGKFEPAVDAYFQVVAEHPSSEWTAGARLGIGRSYVRLGDPEEAMTQFQEVRNLHPDVAEAEEALDWLTLLFRFYGYPMMGEPISFRRETTFDPRLKDDFKDIIAVRISPSGVHMLERGRDRVISFDRAGKFTGSLAAADPHGLFVDARGELVVANEKGLTIEGKPAIFRVPSDKGPQQLEKIRNAVRDRLGDVYVYDDDEKKVLRFRRDGELVGAFPDAQRREILTMEVDAVGNVIMLDKKERGVDVLSPDGSVLARIPAQRAPSNLKKAVDIALDPAGYLYVLDEDEAAVAVFDAGYQFVTRLTSQNLGQGVLAKPVSLDVDASGDLYVYDDKAKALIHLR
ncbi:MAG TPA: tetratricopeptide repeat protein [Vicinamibacteria bacterium]|nr:tetratricopeptide repeat protein [Vicinamibacteria bacterium]